MKNNIDELNYFFVDEAGDPTFYNKYGRCIVGKEGCSKILLLGFIKTKDPNRLRGSVLKLRDEIAEDSYLKKIPSVEKTKLYFHAKDDCPEVREKFYKLILDLDFKAEFVVARKIPSLFKNKYKSNKNIFYDDLVSKLFENKLHVAKKNFIYFAVRGSKTRQAPFETAIQTAVASFENKWKMKNDSEINIHPQSPLGEPCLQIIDYMNWAVQRVFIRGEDRYVKFVEEKISFLVDIYDLEKYPKNFYNKSNKFDINKISPL